MNTEAEEQFGVIARAWDETAVPPRPDGVQTVDDLYEHIETLEDVIRELARKCNKQESVSQSLAAANVRQAEILARLRSDVLALKLKLKDADLGLSYPGRDLRDES